MIANKDEALIRAIKNHCCGGKGKNVTLEELSVTQNGEYTPDSGKAYNKVSVNVSEGGSGKVNIDDIILADDLLEKCEALDFDSNNQAITDWSFSDICVQDSCGVLQSAFEDSVPPSTKGLHVDIPEKNIMFGMMGQSINVESEGGNSYTIFYNNGKYIVGRSQLV